MIRRTPLRRGNAPLRRVPLPRVSRKRRAAEKERQDVRQRVLSRDRGCILGQWGGCGGPLDVDEIIPRGRGGDWLDEENCQTLCRAHHDRKHTRPHVASILGLYGTVMMRKHREMEVGESPSLAELADLAEWALNEFNGGPRCDGDMQPFR